MSGHTPGPWVVVIGKNISVGPCPGKRVALCNYDNGPIEKANATLIAAAPKLLALAEQCASECASCNGTGLVSFKTFPGGIEVDNDDQPCQDCADIREVIAKATGAAA